MSDDHSSALRLITPAASEPLTLAQAKLFLRIDHTADDEAITRAIASARQFAEQYLRTVLLPQTWEYVVANPLSSALRLPLGPAQTISSVSLIAANGTSSVMHTMNYRLSVDGFAVIFANVPTAENVVIRFVASTAATASDVPAPVVQGMLHHIAAMVEARDGVAALPIQAVHCYQPYRRIML
jgi:uncharacterized phiE125 gp8 family phage protein